MRFFLAGIMQGSRKQRTMHAQDYRARIRRALEQHVAGAEVYCPLDDHRGSLGYGEKQGRDVFLHHTSLAAETDVLVAYLPEASMGTAVEMWQAHHAGAVVLTISPMKHNWVVRFLSDRVFGSLEEFEQAAQNGELADLLAGEKTRR